MAKPKRGIQLAREVQRQAGNGRAVDLALKGMGDEQAREVQEILELRGGMRCRGCGRRITVGFQFTSLDPRDTEQPVMRLAACAREDCDFAEKAKDGATCVEAVEFAWCDGNDPDLPPLPQVARTIGVEPQPAAE